jgi:hypothetical protein
MKIVKWLCGRCVARDAWTLLVGRWHRRIVEYLTRVVNREDVLNLAQVVFLKAYQSGHEPCGIL